MNPKKLPYFLLLAFVLFVLPLVGFTNQPGLAGLYAPSPTRTATRTATRTPTHAPTSTQLYMHQLREAAAGRGIWFGTIDAEFWSSGSAGYQLFINTVSSEFNSITPEVYMKFENTHPCPPPAWIAQYPQVHNWVVQHGQENPDNTLRCTLINTTDDEYEWGRMNVLLNWANQNDLGIRGHTLIWHNQNPQWLDNATSWGVPSAAIENLMLDHIANVIAHTCSLANVYAYDVVNEAVDDFGNLKVSVWSVVPDYGYKAFIAAKNAINSPPCSGREIRLYYVTTQTIRRLLVRRLEYRAYHG